VGKSALVRQIRSVTVARRGLYAEGKCDQLRRDIPYLALREALSSLVRALLTLSDQELSVWRARIQAALADQAQLLIDLVPELLSLIGPQPPVESLMPPEAQAQFQRVFARFIEVFACADRPFTLFIDDLQWIDASTLGLLQALLEDPERRGLVVVGAYRDGEVTSGHPLAMMLEELRRTVPVHSLELGPLSIDSVAELIADTLAVDCAEMAELARLVHDKTGGNAFFTVQLLETLYQERLLFRSGGRWRWDSEGMARAGFEQGVLDLVIHKLLRLPRRTQEALRLGACIGSTFRLVRLAQVMESDERQAARDLSPALDAGLLLATGAHMRFVHDRVQQAAYALIDIGERDAVHLRIGRVMLERADAESAELFDIVSHLNHGRGLMRDADERNTLLDLNLAATERARASVAYQSMLAFTRVAHELLSDRDWQERGALAARVHLRLAEALYLNGRLADVHAHVALVLERTSDKVTAIRANEILIIVAMARGKPSEAAAIALELLRSLGIRIPVEVREADIIKEFLRCKLRLALHSRKRLMRLPEIRDPEILATLEFLMLSLPAVSYGAPAAFPLLLMKILALTLQHGHSFLSPVPFLGFAIILARIGRYREAREYTDLAWKLQARFGSKKVKVYLASGWALFLRWYWEPPRDVARYMETECYPEALEVGNLEFVAHEQLNSVALRFLAGDALHELVPRCRSAIDTMERVKQWTTLDATRPLVQAITNLVSGGPAPGRLAGEHVDPDALAERVAREGNMMGSFLFATFAGYLDILFGDGTRAHQLASEVASLRETLPVTYFHPLFVMVESLALLRVEGAAQKKKVAGNLKLLRRWASQAPAELGQRSLLVEAELMSVVGKAARAEVLYERAARVALGNGAIQDAALARELYADHCARAGRAAQADEQRVLAHRQYRQWGAQAKVAALEARHPWLRVATAPGPADTDAARPMDLESVWKASRALSGDLVLRRLLHRLIEIMIENAGAQAGALILQREGEGWKVEAQARQVDRQGDADVSVLGGIALEDAGFVPQSLIHYVVRTGQSLVLHDVEAELSFAGDPYFVTRPVKSLLAIPIVIRGGVTAVLYLDNALTKGAFTEERVEFLTLLSGQAAVSIENALLYESLERKVEERTQKLEELQAVALANAHAMGMAEIATDVLHNVGNILNGVNICCDTLDAGLRSSRVSNLTRASQLLCEQGDRLPEFLVSDPKGRALPRYFVQVSDALTEENRRALDEVAELRAKVERIMEVVAAQQSYATGEFLSEDTDLSRVVEDALRLQAQSLATRRVEVVKCYQPIRRVAVQRTKLVHVLVNLLKNADEAMQTNPPTERVLSIDIGADAQASPFVRIADNGHGIEADDLERIFAHGFSTKRHGRGFGLHSCANSMTEMGGRLTAASDGPGRGAVFTLSFCAAATRAA
jgi:predicted ATPase/signal transduction histidine kinase